MLLFLQAFNIEWLTIIVIGCIILGFVLGTVVVAGLVFFFVKEIMKDFWNKF